MASAQLASVPVLPFPPAEVRNKIPLDSWNTCVHTWESILQICSYLPSESFESVLGKSGPASLSNFVQSYIEETSVLHHESLSQQDKVAIHLRRLVYTMIHRILKQAKVLPDLLCQWSFLGYCCNSFRHMDDFGSVVETAWTKNESRLNASLQKYKSVLVTIIDSGKVSAKDIDLFSHCLLPLIRLCPSAGVHLLAGSDLLDTIIEQYSAANSSLQSKLLLLVYLMFLSPLQIEKSNRSLLYDHLYSMKDNAEKNRNSLTGARVLLEVLVTETPFLTKSLKLLSNQENASRIAGLIKSLGELRNSRGSQSRPPRRKKPVRDKGKGKEADSYGHGESFNDIHVHKMSLISQVQDLFPDLGNGFVVRLLDEYDNNVEIVVAHLLEDNLPLNLSNLDRGEQIEMSERSRLDADIVPDLVPRSTPPPSPPSIPKRRNVFDNDEMDRLAVSDTQIRFGKKDTDKSIFNQDTSSRSASKAAIMSALAAFDADDDERDDTYDIEDVGGTVDANSGPDGDTIATINDLREKNEEALWSAWKMDPKQFGRDAATRRGNPRDALRSETGMTDEAIEGWAIMLQRDPKKIKRLEARYSTFGGQQSQLDRTSYRKELADGLGTESEDTDGVSSGGEASRGGRGGRGRGGRGRGRGGANNVAGPTGEKDTQIGRQRKEANKSSRANHNRRDQRAKKIARGFAG